MSKKKSNQEKNLPIGNPVSSPAVRSQTAQPPMTYTEFCLQKAKECEEDAARKKEAWIDSRIAYHKGKGRTPPTRKKLGEMWDAAIAKEMAERAEIEEKKSFQKREDDRRDGPGGFGVGAA